jgi:histidine phosphotransferase ChpT
VNPIDFASLLCSRLCHDLVNPIGALTNGAELLAEEQDPDMVASCVKLLDDSARQTAALLTFFRLAFGGGGGYGNMVAIKEPISALTGKFPPPKIALDVHCSEAELPKPVVKIMMNLGLIAGEALVRGGTLRLMVERSGPRWRIAFRSEGPRVIVPEELIAALSTSSAAVEPTPRVAPALIVMMMLEQMGGTVSVSPVGSEQFEVSAEVVVTQP